MRRRERFVGVTWLAGIEGQPGEGRTAMRPSQPGMSVAELMADINSVGYLVEMERDSDRIVVRCLPIRERMKLHQPVVALSYSGTDLRHILSAASYEMRQLRTFRTRFDTSGREITRWVP